MLLLLGWNKRGEVNAQSAPRLSEKGVLRGLRANWRRDKQQPECLKLYRQLVLKPVFVQEERYVITICSVCELKIKRKSDISFSP